MFCSSAEQRGVRREAAVQPWVQDSGMLRITGPALTDAGTCWSFVPFWHRQRQLQVHSPTNQPVLTILRSSGATSGGGRGSASTSTRGPWSAKNCGKRGKTHLR